MFGSDRHDLGSRRQHVISDGYVNSRVAKVDKNGRWLKSSAKPGDQPGQLKHAA